MMYDANADADVTCKQSLTNGLSQIYTFFTFITIRFLTGMVPQIEYALTFTTCQVGPNFTPFCIFSRRFRTGPGVVPAKVPQDVENLVIVLNGREDSKIEFSTVWLNYLTSSLPRLINLAVVMLGNEMCVNRYTKNSSNKTTPEPNLARGGG